MKYIFILFILFIFNSVVAKDIVVKDTANKSPVENREAILILPGFGTVFHSLKDQKKAFSNLGYDLFIPDYLSKKTMAECTNNVCEFIEKHHLEKYKKINVFAYIIGSWTINDILKQKKLTNVSSIVYNRSPFQERAPIIAIEALPLISKILFGKVITELANTPYVGIENKEIKIGVLVEGKASKLIHNHKKRFDELGPVVDFNQSYDDLAYVFLDHDQMYTEFDITAPEVFIFIKTGKFSKRLSRTQLTRDPFEIIK
jgi:hypothetical protein